MIITESKRKVLVLTGGGDCPGLNAVIRGIVKRSRREKDWAVYGSIEAFNGVLKDPLEVLKLSNKNTAGIHVKGGTILKTTNKGNPFEWPIRNESGEVSQEDRSDQLINKIEELNFEAVINIGGDGSQRISQKLFEKGMNIIGVPKTIDNDVSSTDYTFGFNTAVQIASDSLDKLVTTAESHHRVMIMEVMGRDAGWIALHSAVAGGADVCLIPEIPYDIKKVVHKINKRIIKGKGFVNIVVAEGAKPLDGKVVSSASNEVGYEHERLGGIAFQLSAQLKAAGCKADIRETVLGHTQRGGTPTAYDRVLASMFGVKAFEMVLDKEYGKMVAIKGNKIITVTLKDAIGEYNYIDGQDYLVSTARGLGISFGD